MTILILTDFFPPINFGGAENIAYSLAKEYVKSGYRVIVYCVNEKLKRGDLVKLFFEEIEIYQFGCKKNHKYYTPSVLYNFYSIRNLKKILKQNNIDVAHFHNIHKYISYHAISLVTKDEIPSYITIHDALSIDYGKYSQGVVPNEGRECPSVDFNTSPIKLFFKNWKRYIPLRNFFIRYQFSKLKKIICVSSELEKLLNQNKIRNTMTIHNGVRRSIGLSKGDIHRVKRELGIDNEDFILLFAGRISPEKGVDICLQILERIFVLNAKLSLKLIIAGKKITIPKHLKKSIVNLGWSDSKKMQDLYSISDMIIVPSLYLDPFPTVIIEGMSFGVPAIVSSYSGGKEAIKKNINGYVVNPYDLEKITEILIENIETKDKFKKSEIEEYFQNNYELSISSKKYISLFNS